MTDNNVKEVLIRNAEKICGNSKYPIVFMKSKCGSSFPNEFCA